MKLPSTILLLMLLLFPIIWNGVSIVHYVVEHTHTFCQTELEHSHTNPDNCLSLFQLSENQDLSHLPTTTEREFQELKQYLTPNLILNPTLFLSSQQINFINPIIFDNGFPKDVFHPPISA